MTSKNLREEASRANVTTSTELQCWAACNSENSNLILETQAAFVARRFRLSATISAVIASLAFGEVRS